MGIKDSDDCITARAANPRTGLISPSPAATPRTPESPAEALKLRSQRVRPALTRANEARKISTCGLQKWCADEHGWSREDAKSGVASPRPSDTSVGAADIVCGETEAVEDTLRGDRFVVHMPSAREPQPYAFPGRSAEEIQAYEHYKQKARKTSGDGWDQRCVQNGGIKKTSATEYERGRKRVMSGGVMPGQFPTRDRTVIRRSILDLEGSAMPGADVHFAAASFAPYLSPKTPSRKTSNGRRPKTIRTLREYTAADNRTLQESPPITHLSQLPKLRLVRPELASLPMPKLRQVARKSTRACSLGCDRTLGDSCPQLAGSPKQARPLLETTAEAPTSFPAEHAAALAVYFLGASCATHDRLGATVRIRIPRPAVLVTLTSPNARLEERITAIKTLLNLAGQIVGVFMAVSVLWKLLVAVAGVVGMLVWPLVVPLKLVW